MNFPRFFIDRPIFAWVIALVIMLASLTLLALGIFGPGIATGLVSGAPQLGAGAMAGAAMVVIGLVLTFVAITYTGKLLKVLMVGKAKEVLHSAIGRGPVAGIASGALVTTFVQSSSTTTSLMVPLAGAGVVRLRRVLPFMMGANLGTTVTSLLAATANPIAAAMTVALFHVIFNLTGTAIWWPLRVIPLRIATWYGRLAGQHIRYAFLFLIGVFLIVPLVGITLTEFFIRLR